jgi:hypothetical protein
VGDQAEDSTQVEVSYTLYDARERHPSRTEYHLYYSDSPFKEAQPGDLLVLFRDEDERIQGLVARKGTSIEARLMRLLSLGDAAELDRFAVIQPPALTRQLAIELVEVLAPAPPTEADYVSFVASELAKFKARSIFPGTSEMARLAALAVQRAHGNEAVDGRLWLGLEAETAIYFSLEDAIKGQQLEQLQGAGGGLAEVTSFVMTMLQSRRSRRGHSLQNHFAFVLNEEGIPFSAQCATEPGETPDFLVPGCSAYHDLDWPSSRLRMVACKTTAKERWRQVLNEAARIPTKFLLTLDQELTKQTLDAMHSAGLRPFAPAPVISRHYTDPAVRLIGTVGELLQELRVIL